MTNHAKEQVLELAKKHGAIIEEKHVGSPVAVYFDELPKLLAYTAAIEERNLARVAMLINGIDWAKRQFGSISFGDDVPIDNLLSAATVGYDNMAKLQATYSTSTAAFLAERDADKARLEWLEKLFSYSWNGVVDSGSRTYWTIPSSWRHTVQLMEGFTFREAIDNAMAAEKRKQAGQGKEGGK